MLALIHNGAVIDQVMEGDGVQLPDGRYVSPATDGWFSVAPTEPVAEGETPAEDVPDGYELRAIAAADTVPAGHRIVSTSVEMISGSPKFVHVVEEMSEDEIWAPVRAERDARLAACDWTQLADSPLSIEDKAAWAVYRQALRDVPSTQSDPANIEWPSAPA